MCASCGFPAVAGHWTDAGASEPADRLRNRFRRAQVLKSVLKTYGLTAHDGGSVPGIQVGTLAGASAMALDLAEVWQVAEQLCGKPVDPLDARFTGGAA
jgi:hypothetical protein